MRRPGCFLILIFTFIFMLILMLALVHCYSGWKVFTDIVLI